MNKEIINIGIVSKGRLKQDSEKYLEKINLKYILTEEEERINW